jgi:predicted transcriptional regulator
MAMKTISFRTETERVEELDALASTQQRDRTFVINEALDNYVALQQSHRELILAGIAAGEAGKLTPHADVVAMIEKWRQAK